MQNLDTIINSLKKTTTRLEQIRESIEYKKITCDQANLLQEYIEPLDDGANDLSAHIQDLLWAAEEMNLIQIIPNKS